MPNKRTLHNYRTPCHFQQLIQNVPTQINVPPDQASNSTQFHTLSKKVPTDFSTSLYFVPLTGYSEVLLDFRTSDFIPFSFGGHLAVLATAGGMKDGTFLWFSLKSVFSRYFPTKITLLQNYKCTIL